jgi:hypothetical protein
MKVALRLRIRVNSGIIRMAVRCGTRVLSCRHFPVRLSGNRFLTRALDSLRRTAETLGLPLVINYFPSNFS